MDNGEENKKINIPTEEKKENLNQNPNIVADEDYQEYKVEDLTISSIFNEDINEKINKLITYKKEDNLKFEKIKQETEENRIKIQEEKNQKEENEKKLKELEEKAKKLQEEKEKKELRDSKLKEGFNKLNNYISIKCKKNLLEILRLNKLFLLNINNGLILIDDALTKAKSIKLKKNFFKKLLLLKKENIELKKLNINEEIENNKEKDNNKEIENRQEIENKGTGKNQINFEEKIEKEKMEDNKENKGKIEKEKKKENKEKEIKGKRNNKEIPINQKKINDNNYLKAQMKLKKLEFKKNRENEYIKMIERQKKRKEEIIHFIDSKIKIQNKKIEKSMNKKNNKDSDSEKSMSLNNITLESKSDIENGVELLIFTITNNISHHKLEFFQNFIEKIQGKKHKKKMSPKGRRYSTMYSRKFSKKKINENKNSYIKKNIIEDIEKDENQSVTNILELEEDESFKEDSFIKLKEPQYTKTVDKSQLVEYDLFYKEQFFKNEVFLYDVKNIEDKVEAEIKKEMNRLEIKRKLIEKKKLKEVNILKKLDTKDLEKEIEQLQKSYEMCKKKEEPKVELELNNTEGFLHNGRMLGNYFQENEEMNIPRFSMESEKEIGAREVIDFKVLRKEEVARRYFDYCCCLQQRKEINKILVYARYFCRFFVDNWIFDNLSLLIIITNTVLILISDPTDSNNIGNKSDIYFLFFYTIEAFLKIISFTFISAEDAYIKDYWNILDFFVVIVGWISLILEKVMNGTKISGLAGLRAFRILRPLKTVKRFKGLKKLVTALLASIGHLGETSIILFFFFLIFAIAGTQMWQGLFYRRCMSVNYGYLVSTQGDTGMCSFDSNCEEYNSYGNTFICAKGYRNPNSGAVNFDNTLTALVTVFVMVTLEGWTDLFTYVSKTFKDKIYINPIIIFCYFHVFVFIAAFYLINLFLAVTNSEFEHIEVSRKQLKEKKSFYKLIQGKYDHKEREKKERKEKERQLKANNNKKSDETLKELYYKITDEAYHINKNKKSIPILYSTVKDMYIMTNKNPEDLYLQTLQIEAEDKFLSKDIKRQQREIDDLIKKKKKEVKKKENNISKIREDEPKKVSSLRRTKTNKEIFEGIKLNYDKKKGKVKDKDKDKLANNENKDILKRNKSILPRKSSSLNININEEEKGKESDSKKQDIKHNNISNIIKTINSDIIEISIDNTQKFLKEKIADKSKDFNSAGKKKKKIEANEENKKDAEIVKFEDLSFEKIERKSSKRKNEKKENLDRNEGKRSRINIKRLTKIIKDQVKITGLSEMTNKNSKRSSSLIDKDDEERKNVRLPQELSLIYDLSLSDIEENPDKKQIIKLKKQLTNTSKILLRQKIAKILNKPSYEEKSENNINNAEKTEKSLISKDSEENSPILKERDVLFDTNNNFNIRSKFSKPYSLLNFFHREKKKQLNQDRAKIIEKKYKKMKNPDKKEDSKDSEKESHFSLSKIGNEDSFIQFVENIKKKENMDVIFKKENENENYDKKTIVENYDKKTIIEKIDKKTEIEKTSEIEKKEKENEIKNDNNNLNKSFTSSILNDDNKSLISFYDEVSLDDIKLLPDNIINKKIYKVDYLINDNIRKNLELNKLTQLIRNSFFDRESINTEINLTTKQQSDHFKKMNRRLNNLLFVDAKKIRGRLNRNDDLDVSYVAEKRDYEKILEHLPDEDEEELKKRKKSLLLPSNIELNKENLQRNPLKEIMNGYQEKIIEDNKQEIEEEKQKEKEKENDLNKIFKSLRKKESEEGNIEILNSEANLLGPKKSSERVNLNNDTISKKSTKNIFSKLTKKTNIENKENKENIDNIDNKDNKAIKRGSIISLSFFQKLKERTKKNQLTNIENNIKEKKTFKIIQSQKKSIFIFKAKSIEKNIIKYPQENSKRFQIREENRVYTDPLTVTQELISDNLRGKKYYLNYLYNIADKDLKVKDNFKIDHWEKEILGNNEKTFKKKPLPENNEAFFVFNDKKLNLQKYTYMYHKDLEFAEKDLTFLTHNLKYLPLNVLEIIPLRLRNFGKFAVGKEINPGIMGTKPTSMEPDPFKSLKKPWSGKETTIKPRNETNIITSSSYTNNRKYQDEVTFKKNIHDRIYKKVDEFNYKTISHYFLIEDNLYFQLVDLKRREEIIQKISERNREKENRIEIKDEIKNIHEFDIKTNSRRYIEWSGTDVLCHQDKDENRKRWNSMINALEDFNMIIWHQNSWIQRFQKLRYAFYILATNEYFDYIVLSIVIINSVFMALDGNLLTPEVLKKLEISNYVFNSIFILEYIVKFIGLSPYIYYSDAFTYLDTLIIAFAILDMCTPNEDTGSSSKDRMRNVSSKLSFLRVFRIFRVIRLTKVLRRLKSMRLIIVSIKKALSNVSYIICILIMFILIFQLLGMSLLSGNIHYQSFFIGFYTTYQILTMENWNSLLYEIWPMNYLSFFYFLAWIFIGNYVIFNLFISILLQSFDEGEEEDEDDFSYDEKVERMYLLPAYLNMIKKSAYSNKKFKLKAYRKKFDKSNGANNNNNTNDSQSFSVSKDLTASKVSNSNQESYYKSSINENYISMDQSKSMIDQNINEDNFGFEDENQGYASIVSRNLQYWRKVNALFAKNDCENSLYFLSQTNRFRIFCMRLIINKWFDRFILFLILCSTTRLVVDTFVSGYEFVLTFDILDAIFNILFLLECLFKIFAMGFVVDEGSYLTDNWNKIDIIIVICSAFDFQNLFTKYFTSGNGSSSVQFLKVIRLLRTLRPLRFISHNVQLKLIITSLFDSILSIINALFIVIVVYYMFSIVGISLFYSNMSNCYILNSEGYFDLAIESFKDILLDYEVSDDMVSISNFCSGRYNGIMNTGPAFKFSNIITSFITSYCLSTMEGWPDIMYSYTIYEMYYGIYFLVSNLVVAYFFLNLFTGIMFRYFNDAFKREQKIAEDDKKAPKYYDFLAQICDAETHYIVWKKPLKGTFQYYLRELADNPHLDNFIMVIIFLNMIFMALNYDGNSYEFNLFLSIVNYIFTGIFILECIIKLLGYGFIGYFHSGWNRFDFFVVIASLVDIAVANIEGFDASFLKSFQIIRVLRVLRITRALRLIKSLKGLEKLIQTLSWSLTALANVLLLMLIFFCIFAILGCYFYDNIRYENYKDIFVYINEYYNFDNFYYSFLLVFRCATGENWNNIMMEMAFINPAKASETYAYIYFIVSNFTNSIIMLNLFLMVTLQQYDEFTNKNYNPIEKFESFLIDFNNSWNKFSDDKDQGFRIKKIYVIQFFMDFNWKKLNFPEQGKLENVKKYVTDLKLRTDDDDYVYYHDVIYKIINKQMGSLIDRNNPDNNTIFKKEIKVQKQIKKMIKRYIRRHSKNKSSKAKHFTIPFNPLTSHLYFKYSYFYIKTFMGYYKENCEILKNMEEQSKNSKKET